MARVNPRTVDIDAIVHAPLRRRSRARAALNLLAFLSPFIAAGLWLAGVRP